MVVINVVLYPVAAVWVDLWLKLIGLDQKSTDAQCAVCSMFVKLTR